ncbi:preprotein translocase subunit YajC [Asticcacaulis sp. SL142]|uniref:preprotein translocase subunit YajC n=1 Tax=Asticcacaulis sp. SL142 TaxID=2995155 RepID=UPI003B6425B1
MFATPAFAQAATDTAAASGGLAGAFTSFLPLIGIFALMYFLVLRPQQKRAKEHQAQIAAIKRNDTVVLSNGMIGKVTRVEDAEVMVEIATGVNVRVVKGFITEIRTKGEPAPANDSKAA